MVDKKIIFIDCDNTLMSALSDGTEYIPESALMAIEMAKKNGVLVYLCTGRSLVEMNDIIYSVGFDGIIGSSGAFIMENEELIYHRSMNEEDVKTISRLLSEKEVAYMYESNKGVYANKLMIEFYRQDPKTLPFALIMKDIYEADLSDVNKVCYLSEGLSADTVNALFDNRYDIVKYSYGTFEYGGEISTKNVSKGSAVKMVLENKKIPFENSYSIGDSYNDVSMFKSTKYAALVGNCMDGLDEYADFKSTDLDEDGVFNIFKHYELI